jgi:hypothetical protein
MAVLNIALGISCLNLAEGTEESLAYTLQFSSFI